jgi:hypothetical protein
MCSISSANPCAGRMRSVHHGLRLSSRDRTQAPGPPAHWPPVGSRGHRCGRCRPLTSPTRFPGALQIAGKTRRDRDRPATGRMDMTTLARNQRTPAAFDRRRRRVVERRNKEPFIDSVTGHPLSNVSSGRCASPDHCEAVSEFIEKMNRCQSLWENALNSRQNRRTRFHSNDTTMNSTEVGR